MMTNYDQVLTEEEMNDFFSQLFPECGLPSDYFEKAEYRIEPYISEDVYTAPEGVVTIRLNDSGDKVEWLISKKEKLYVHLITLSSSDETLLQSLSANFYSPSYS